jgi:hypothetical protein
MKNEEMTFKIQERNSDYCDSCQDLEVEGPAGMKTHRSIPLDTVTVKSKLADDKDYFLTLCGDCLAVAQNQGVTVLKNGEAWKRNDMVIMREELRA